MGEKREKEKQNMSPAHDILSLGLEAHARYSAVPAGTKLRPQIAANLKQWHKPITPELVSESEHEWGAGREWQGGGMGGVR